MTKKEKMTKNEKFEKMKKMKKIKKIKKRKIKKMKKILKEIITKSVQNDAGATFVRIRNSHGANVPFLQKRKNDKKRKSEQIKKVKKLKKRKKQEKTTPPSFCVFLPSRLVQCVDMNQLCDEPRVYFVSFYITNDTFCRYEHPTPN